jgi:hydrogenase expression/formation protein HypC
MDLFYLFTYETKNYQCSSKAKESSTKKQNKMCLAIPGKVLKIKDSKAIIDYVQGQREAIIHDDSIKEGDYVLVQQGLVVQKISEKEALESINAWKTLLSS